LLLRTAHREEIGKRLATFVCQYSTLDGCMMVDLRLREQVEHTARRPRLVILRAKHNASDTRVEHGADAHHTRLQGDKKFAANQTVIADALSGIAQRGDLGMGSGIMARDRRIEAAPDNFASLDHYGTYRHLTSECRLFGKLKRLAHEISILHQYFSSNQGAAT
jgi:hypothetical protein